MLILLWGIVKTVPKQFYPISINSLVKARKKTLNFRKCYNPSNAAARGNVTFNIIKANMSMSEEFENATKVFPNLCKFTSNLAGTKETTR